MQPPARAAYLVIHLVLVSFLVTVFRGVSKVSMSVLKPQTDIQRLAYEAFLPMGLTLTIPFRNSMNVPLSATKEGKIFDPESREGRGLH
jgi:hypothetical protein